MGFLASLFGASVNHIYAPVSGNALPLNQVQDPAFATGLLGKGIAIIPAEGRIVAPCDATVDTLFDTAHAITLLCDFGAELLIHVGLDTVNLKGRHFIAHVQSGQKVKKGQLLIEFDLEAVKAEGYDPVTPVVICNSEIYRTISTYTGKQVSQGDAVIKVSL